MGTSGEPGRGEWMDSVSDKPFDDEASDEPGGPTIEPSSEMMEAVREAEEAMEAREKGANDPSDDHSPDKVTIVALSKELQDLKALYDEKQSEIDGQTDQHARLQAEFENFRRRSLKEKQESFKFGHQNLVKDLLSVVDNLERALEHGAENAGEEAKGILDGVALVYREILGAFAKHGVREIDAEGQPFDPAVHEALGQVPAADRPVNSVMQVLQKGYVIHDRMLRPSRVMVSCEADPAAGGTSAPQAEEGSD